MTRKISLILILLLLVTTPASANFTPQASTAVNGWMKAVAVRGDHAFCADNADLKAYDYVSSPGFLLPEMGDVRTTGNIYDIVVRGDWAFVSTNGGFGTYDISDPAAPTVGDEVSYFANAYGCCVAGDRAYVAVGGEILVYDVSDETAISPVGSVASASVYRLTVKGRYLYAACWGSGLLVYDTSTANPTLVGSYAPGQSVNDVALKGDHALLVCSNGWLLAVDVSDPTNPTYAGMASLTMSGTPTRIAVYGDYAYIASSGAGLYHFDVSDPTSPQDGSLYSGYPAGGLDVAHDLVFAGMGTSSPYSLMTFTANGLNWPVESPPIQQNKWFLMGIPTLLIDPADGIPTTLFLDDMVVPYNDTWWIMSRYNEATDSYDRFDENGQVGGLPALMTPGRGYWFIHNVSADKVIDVGNTQYTEPPFDDITLAGELPAGSAPDPAQVMLANPFVNAYSVMDMTFGGATWTEAVASEGLNANVYTYDHDAQNYVAVAYDEAVLTPWQGFWLIRTGGLAALDVTFPRVSPSKSRTPQRPESWLLRLAVTTDDGAFCDLHSGLGGHALAAGGYDARDAFQLTPPGPQYVTLSFPCGDRRLAVDYRELDLAGSRTWDLEVHTRGLPSRSFTLTWPEIGDLDPALEFRLLDAAGADLVADMRAVDHLDFVSPAADDAVIGFSVVVTAPLTGDDETPRPGRTAIVAVHPNPFNPATSISFDLAAPREVDMAVYDLQGRRVAQVASGRHDAGRHTVRWDASGLAAGTYLVRMTTADGTSVSKISLVK